MTSVKLCLNCAMILKVKLNKDTFTVGHCAKCNCTRVIAEVEKKS